jgi:hypothetical protein
VVISQSERNLGIIFAWGNKCVGPSFCGETNYKTATLKAETDIEGGWYLNDVPSIAEISIESGSEGDLRL